MILLHDYCHDALSIEEREVSFIESECLHPNPSLQDVDEIIVDFPSIVELMRDLKGIVEMKWAYSYLIAETMQQVCWI